MAQNIFCISCYFKGEDFLRAAKEAGNRVYLLTDQKLADNPWPRESIDEFFYMPNIENTAQNLSDISNGLAYFLRNHQIDIIVALDDFDVEKAAFLREEFRIPGMGQTTARHFRDKLAMRMKAHDAGINVPPFSPLFNDETINRFLGEVSAPWLIKPRSEASAAGIRKIHSAEEAWQVIHELGDKRHQYLIEQFKPGTVYHADALSYGGKMLFCSVSAYLNTPFEVAHGGGVFRTCTLEFGSKDDKAIQKENTKVLKAFGMQHGASHTEYIKAEEDGKFYFLETASRVGGAHIAEMVEMSSGINLWKEWARIEHAVFNDLDYIPPKPEKDHAGILVSLSRFQWPDTAVFSAPEIVWRLNKEYHIGMILKSPDRNRVLHLLEEYAREVLENYHASLPAGDKPSN